MTATFETPKDTIVRLAALHGIEVTHHPLDNLAAAITHLADDDVHQPDAVEMMLIRLKQKGHIEGDAFIRLLHAYLKESA